MFGSLHPHTRFDLHLHTDRSDGRFAPTEVLERCARGGLEVVALTDHDLGPDLTPGWHDVGDRRLFLLAGAELTGAHEGREYHLLVYFPGQVPAAFHALCTQQCAERRARYTAAVERLDLPGLSPPRAEAPTRLHLARDLVDAGHAPSVRHAFSRYLSQVHRKVPTMSLSFTDAIRQTRALGGITSWAHPPMGAVEQHARTFADAGLHGLEALRPSTGSKDRRRYRRVAAKHGLFLTGGSDWHGWGDPESLGLFRVHAHEITGFVGALAAA